ncbi:MAG: COPII-coated vesicle component Hrf1/Yif1 [Amphiamblys sp. WSBS2006]|nr:MAG: COPII-coated vesicle component Hrf1/Yif1 [Amphiamblys sp. WSBS2006]
MEPDPLQNTININPLNPLNNLLSGTEYINRTTTWMNRLRVYFDVTNKYLLWKTVLILFPFRHKTWKRRNEEQSDLETPFVHSTPANDINAPDLYIPLVSLTAFVLLKGLLVGIGGAFHTDTLGLAGSYSVLTLAALVIFVKVSCYVFGFGAETSVLNIAAVLGYNFVNICLVTVSAMLFGTRLKTLARGYIFVSMSFFIIRSLLHSLSPESRKILSQSRKKKLNFLLAIVLVQLVFSFLLTR